MAMTARFKTYKNTTLSSFRMKVFFATRVRGFFMQLFNAKNHGIEFSYASDKVYETNSTFSKIKNIIGRSRLFDFLGIIQQIKGQQTECDMYGSFNRFLNVDKPYFIYVENPTALFHYRLSRNQSYLGHKRLTKLINDKHLKGLVFMSNACASTFETVCSPIREECFHTVIYPYIPENKNISLNAIDHKANSQTFNLLFIAQGSRFLSKGALEVVEAFKKLKGEKLNLRLRMITSINDVNKDLIASLQEIDGISINDFKYSFEELQAIYAESHLYVQPTSDDSFNITVLESLKSGLPIISSRLYAIPEMVIDGKNGFLCDPNYWFFDKSNIPNPKVWNNRKHTIYSGKTSPEITDFLVTKIKLLYNNRDLWRQMAYHSLNKASQPPFSTTHIAAQWKSLTNSILS